jgi:hypothetical protein
MSYAGPASRGKRASVVESITPPSSRSVSTKRQPGIRQTPAIQMHAQARTAVFMGGVALGLVVGAGIALLLAPQSGHDARRALLRRGRRLSRRGRNAWEDLRDEFQRLAERRRRTREWEQNGAKRVIVETTPA